MASLSITAHVTNMVTISLYFRCHVYQNSPRYELVKKRYTCKSNRTPDPEHVAWRQHERLVPSNARIGALVRLHTLRKSSASALSLPWVSLQSWTSFLLSMYHMLAQLQTVLIQQLCTLSTGVSTHVTRWKSRQANQLWRYSIRNFIYS